MSELSSERSRQLHFTLLLKRLEGWIEAREYVTIKQQRSAEKCQVVSSWLVAEETSDFLHDVVFCQSHRSFNFHREAKKEPEGHKSINFVAKIGRMLEHASWQV